MDPTKDPTDVAARSADRADRHDDDVQDLKATEDSIRADLQRLTHVEQEKSRLDPADPRVDSLSDEAVELASRIHRQTVAERALSGELE